MNRAQFLQMCREGRQVLAVVEETAKRVRAVGCPPGASPRIWRQAVDELDQAVANTRQLIANFEKEENPDEQAR